jgi:small subunit ribosomal protein S17
MGRTRKTPEGQPDDGVEATAADAAAPKDVEPAVSEQPEATAVEAVVEDETPTVDQPAEEAAEVTPEPAAVAEPAAEPDAATPVEAPAPVAEGEPAEVPAPEAVADELPARAEEPAAQPASAPAAPAKTAKSRAARKLTSAKRAASKKAARAATATGDRKPITRLQKPDRVRSQPKERRGVVVSDAMDKTIVVRVELSRPHRAYKKVVRRSQKLHAHDAANQAKVGDVVRIVETRPISKTKSWRLAEVIEAAR